MYAIDILVTLLMFAVQYYFLVEDVLFTRRRHIFPRVKCLLRNLDLQKGFTYNRHTC